MDNAPKARILIVEDERIVALNLQSSLQALGYETAGAAANGEDAIRMARELAPDLILMDIRMPGQIDGIQAAKTIRAERYVPVIYLTAYADLDTLSRAKITEPFGYILKPFDDRELLGTIEMALYKHKMDARLRASEATARKLSRAVEQSPSAIVIAGAGGAIEYVNPSFTRLTGLSQTEVAGRTPQEFSAVRERKDIFNQMLAALRDGREWRGEVESRGAGGEPVWIAAQISPIRDAAGVATDYLAILEDISNRKFMEEELLRAMTAAEESSRTKSEFLSSMSHELRTPMNGILGMTDLCLETQLTREQREYLRLVRQSAHSLLGILNELLDFSRMETGEIELVDSWFRLPELLDKILSPFASEAEIKGLDFSWNIAADVSDQFLGDPRRIGQIVGNLAENAVKFTPKGSVRIDVRRATPSDLPPQEPALPRDRAIMFNNGDLDLLFCVSDTGIGIPPEKRTDIFKSFTQVDGSKTRRYSGIGIGLAIAKSLSDLMDGRLWFESKAGQGSHFYFRVPLKTMAAADSLHAGGFSAKAKPKLRILVADDNTVNRRAVCHILTKCGHMAQEVLNGREALDALQNEIFDLVIMDMQMPVMDGVEATRAIRAMTAGRSDSDIPVIALTARVMEADRKRCLEAGMNAYVTKPVSATELIATIDRVVPMRVESPSMPDGNGPPVFDLNDVLNRFDGDMTLLLDVAAAFLEDAPKQIVSIRTAVDQADDDGLARKAHGLKGSAANIGAGALSTAALRVEITAKMEGAARAQVLVDDLEMEFSRLRNVLGEFLASNMP